jgi:hypothetical protein
MPKSQGSERAARVPSAGEHPEDQILRLVGAVGRLRGAVRVIKEGHAMKLPRREFLHLAAGAAALPAVSRIARAETYPSRPITMIVPFAAGGATDVVGRMMAERMRVSLGYPVFIENQGAAGGTIGVGRGAHAAPDGYTLIMGGWVTHVANGAAYALQYDVLRVSNPSRCSWVVRC